MRRKKRQPIFVRNCDYCGTQLQTNEPNSDSYVITAEHKIFCKIHYVGEPPIKVGVKMYGQNKYKKKAKSKGGYKVTAKSNFKKSKKKKKK